MDVFDVRAEYTKFLTLSFVQRTGRRRDMQFVPSEGDHQNALLRLEQAIREDEKLRRADDTAQK